MADRRPARRVLLMVGIAVVAAVPAFVMGSGPQQTDATWVVTKTAVVTATAVMPTPPINLACTSASGGLGSAAGFTWSPPASTTPSGYTLQWSGAASGSTSTTGGTTTATVPTTGVVIGTINVTVYSDYGPWQSSAGTQTRKVTVLLFGVTWSCS